MVTLRPRQETAVPLEAESLTPDAFAGKPVSQIERLPVLHGNTEAALGEFFSVEGEADDTIRLEGDLSRVKYVGKGMTRGRIEIRGDAGMHLGAEMRGGEIVVHGNAGDWAGAEMRGGMLRVEGNAGHLVGAAYRGSEKGMRGGTILVKGTAGNEVGCTMRRGLIAVGGDAGDFAGVSMLAGSLFIFGKMGIRAGAGMKRGTIVAYEDGGSPPPLLPTFKFDCEYRPAWMGVYLRQLRAWGFPVPQACVGGLYRRYSGDFVELGKGEILVWTLP
ncbi:MAG: formylmethanofuran dehydrogenase subunit C [candidate division NC10 bacterium]|nr:formylmethanofuran dehydrogenase subunit C [candidate division NC10 bacterium]